MQKRKLVYIFLCGILGILLFSSLISSGSAIYTEDITIDGQKDSQYNLAFSGKNFTVYYANSDSDHFLWIEFSYDIINSSIFLEDGELRYNLTKQHIRRTDLESFKNNDSMEIRVFRDVVGDTFSLSTPLDSFQLELNPEPTPPEEEEEEEKKDKEEEKEELPMYPENYSSEWVAWTITVLSCILWPLGFSWRDFFDKKIVECWVEDENGIISSEMETIGEYQDFKFVKDRNMYALIFRHNFKKRIVYSEFNMPDYLSHFRNKRYLWIFYMIDAYLYERQCEEKIVEREYTGAWKLYFVFKFFFSVGKYGSRLFFSFLITGLIISGIFFEWNFIAYLLSGLIGVLIAIINDRLYERGIIKPKRKKEKVQTELILFPSTPKYRIIDIYRVVGEKLQTVKKADKPEKKWEAYEDTIRSFDELQKIVQNREMYRKIKYFKIKEEKRLRSPEEIRSSRHKKLYQMRYLYNQLLSSKDNNRRLQKDNRTLWDRIAHLNETLDQKRREFAMDIIQEQQRTGKSFKEVIKQLYGDSQIGQRWDSVVERALKRIEESKAMEFAKKLETLTMIFSRILDKLNLNGGLGVEITRLAEQLDIKKEDIIDSIKQSEQERTQQED